MFYLDFTNKLSEQITKYALNYFNYEDTNENRDKVNAQRLTSVFYIDLYRSQKKYEEIYDDFIKSNKISYEKINKLPNLKLNKLFIDTLNQL